MRLQALAVVAASIVCMAPMTPSFARSDTEPKTEAPAQAPVSSEPQQTSASFGDWVVRCDRPRGTTGKRICEAAQSLVLKGQQGPIAQIAFARGADVGGLSLAVLLPVSISFSKAPTLGTSEEDTTTLTFRRCVPAGCLADAKVDAGLLKDIRTAQQPGKLTFTDAAERTIPLPISFRGLPQALDDLAKEARN